MLQKILLGLAILGGALAGRFGIEMLSGTRPDPRFLACYSEAPTEERMAACSSLAGDSNETTVNRAVAHSAVGNMLLTEEPDAARTHYETAVRLDPTNAANHINLATALLSLGDVDGAADALEDAAAIDPEGFHFLWARGELSFQQGRYAEAAQQFSALIDRLPEYDAALQRQRSVDHRENRPYTALNVSLLDTPTQVSLHLWRSISLFHAGDRAGAEQARDAAIALDPTATAQLGLRCDLNARQSHNPTAARAICDTAAAYNPESMTPLLNRAIVSLRSRSWQQAVADANTVISRTNAPRSMRDLDMNTPAGVNEMMRMAQNNGQRAQALYARGIARQHLGEQTEGARDIADALEMNSSVRNYFEPLARQLASEVDSVPLDLRLRIEDL